MAALPLNASMMANLSGMIGQMETGRAVASAGTGSWLVIALGTLLYSVVVVLVQAVTQAFNLTLYAEVYRKLVDKRTTALDLTSPVSDLEAPLNIE